MPLMHSDRSAHTPRPYAHAAATGHSVHGVWRRLFSRSCTRTRNLARTRRAARARACTQVNQAAGRLIRSSHDYGALVLLDAAFAQPRHRSMLSSWWAFVHRCACRLLPPIGNEERPRRMDACSYEPMMATNSRHLEPNLPNTAKMPMPSKHQRDF